MFYRHPNFNAVDDFILCGVYIPVFLCGFAVFVPSLHPPLFRLLSDLKFYYMHVKVSILKPMLVF